MIKRFDLLKQIINGIEVVAILILFFMYYKESPSLIGPLLVLATTQITRIIMGIIAIVSPQIRGITLKDIVEYFLFPLLYVALFSIAFYLKK